MKSLRGIFGKARRDCLIPWEVYEASGLCFFSPFCSLSDFHLVQLRARNEWLHRIIGANERITEVVVVAAAVAIIIFKEANE